MLYVAPVLSYVELLSKGRLHKPHPLSAIPNVVIVQDRGKEQVEDDDNGETVGGDVEGRN